MSWASRSAESPLGNRPRRIGLTRIPAPVWSAASGGGVGVTVPGGTRPTAGPATESRACWGVFDAPYRVPLRRSRFGRPVRGVDRLPAAANLPVTSRRRPGRRRPVRHRRRENRRRQRRADPGLGRRFGVQPPRHGQHPAARRLADDPRTVDPPAAGQPERDSRRPVEAVLAGPRERHDPGRCPRRRPPRRLGLPAAVEPDQQPDERHSGPDRPTELRTRRDRPRVAPVVRHPGRQQPRRVGLDPPDRQQDGGRRRAAGRRVRRHGEAHRRRPRRAEGRPRLGGGQVPARPAVLLPVEREQPAAPAGDGHRRAAERRLPRPGRADHQAGRGQGAGQAAGRQLRPGDVPAEPHALPARRPPGAAQPRQFGKPVPQAVGERPAPPRVGRDLRDQARSPGRR